MEKRTEQPSWNPAIRRFFEYVKRVCELEVLDPGDPTKSIPPTTRAFVPLDRVQAFFEHRHHAELKAIIGALQLGTTVDPREIVPRYTAVFCTLLHSGRGSYIKHFTHYRSLNDKALPFDLKNPPPNLPTTAGDASFLSDFCKEQWRFCAPELEEPVSDEHFEEERILPITFKKRLRDGGSAHLWLVNIHPSYNKLISEEAKKRVGAEQAKNFVLKEYSTTDAQKYYDNETSAFRKIGPHPNIIPYYGSFTRSGTFSVILEYADQGTLKEFFEKQLPPSSGEDIIRFWEALFQLINALCKIHTIEGDTTDGPQIFQGWHQDVKPENILVLSNGSKNPQDWQFKLADLGISHFKRLKPSREDSTASDSYGTHTYGAPETSRPDNKAAENRLRVNQNIDIWSLGCIYSEAVRWMADHKLGLIEYQRERKIEASQVHGIAGVDCFHDGYGPLEAVRRSHETAVKRIRSLNRPDFITEAVAYMAKDMLVETKERPTAEHLWRKQGKIVADARKTFQDFKKQSHQSDSNMNSSERTQPRSVTHPVPGPSLNSDPVLPPVLPPGYLPTQGSASRVQQVTMSTAARGQSPKDELPSGVSEDIYPRHHSPDSMDYEHESVATTPLKQQTSLSLSQNTSPLTPPFSPKPRVVPQDDPRGSNEDPFTSPMQHNPIMLPNRSRGTSHIPGYSSSTYNTLSSGIGPSMSGSLGRNHPRREHINSSVNGNGSRGNRRPLSTTTNPWATPSAGDVPWGETSHSNRRTLPHPPVNGYSEVDDPPASTGLPAWQNAVPMEPQYSQHQEPAHRPALHTARSDYMDLDQVLAWKGWCKSTNTYKSCLVDRHQDRLKGRDHVFLIDDSYSMVEHWPNVVKLFEGLSYILKDADKNGLDVHFTISKSSALAEKRTKVLVALVEAQKQRDADARTEINFRLTKILDKYREKLDSNNRWSRKPKPLSLYVLTNGVWETDCTAEIPIKNIVKKLQDLRKDREQIGIQFISFGNDQIGLERLRHLDDDLTTDLELDHDIVDTTPWDDNVYKMLLGHLNESMDHQNR